MTNITQELTPQVNLLAPRNVMVTAAYIKGKLDLKWDEMSHLDPNIIGYNIYRSQIEENSTFRKINLDPIGVTFYHDGILDEYVREEVTSQFKNKNLYRKHINDKFDQWLINRDLWNITDDKEILHEYGHLQFLDNYGLNTISSLNSIYKLEKDFEIEIDFRLEDWRIPEDNSINEAGLFFRIDSQNYGWIKRKQSQTEDIYECNIIKNGIEDIPIIVNAIGTYTNGTNGKFKIQRTSDTVLFAYWDGTLFATLGQYDESFVEDARIIIHNQSSTSTRIQTLWNNYQVHEGIPYLYNLILSDLTLRLTTLGMITDNTGRGLITNDSDFVKVYINNQLAEITEVNGGKCLIKINTQKRWDDALLGWYQPQTLNDEDKIFVEYYKKGSEADLGLRKFLFYKVTCLFKDGLETPLINCQPVRTGSDGLTYIWQEAIQRNAWLLDQSGERVMLFIKKNVGDLCECAKEHWATHRHGRSDCPLCWGTAYTGGYEGPFDIIIAPPMVEQAIRKTDRGLKLDYTADTWTGPSPLISQRDFIVRRDGSICSIGPITAPNIRGTTILQQHFSIGHIDRTDMKYKFVEWKVYNREVPTETDKLVTNEKLIRQDGSSREDSKMKSRIRTIENIVY